MLTDRQITDFHEVGHVTVADVLTPEQISAARADISLWSAQFLAELSNEQKQWYLEDGSDRPLLRKLDNPVHHREFF